MTTNILFSGCSFVAGDGLDNGKSDDNHYANVFSKTVFHNNYSINNIGVSGSSNQKIFVDTCIELFKNYYDYVFVGWTSYPRHVFSLGLELYECGRSIGPGQISLVEHNGNNISFSSNFLHDFREKYLLTHCDHEETVDILRYTNILLNISKQLNTKIYFLNNLCHWDENFFTKQDTVLPSDLTNYTQKLLCVENRDDIEIEKLYNKMHTEFESVGGIQSQHWLNLYNSFKNQTIDLGNDNAHPGPQTHKNFGFTLAHQFKEQQ